MGAYVDPWKKWLARRLLKRTSEVWGIRQLARILQIHHQTVSSAANDRSESLLLDISAQAWSADTQQALSRAHQCARKARFASRAAIAARQAARKADADERKAWGLAREAEFEVRTVLGAIQNHDETPVVEFRSVSKYYCQGCHAQVVVSPCPLCAALEAAKRNLDRCAHLQSPVR